MISDFFYSKDFNNSLEHYVFDERFLSYYISKKIQDNGPSSEEIIIKWITEKASVKSINKSKFSMFLSQFVCVDGKYDIKTSYSEILNKVKKFDFEFSLISMVSQEYIYEKLCPQIGQANFDIKHGLPYILALHKITYNKPQEYYSSLYFINILKYQQYYRKLDNCICSIDDGYKKLTIDFVFTDKLITDILFTNGITTIKDLRELSIDSLLVIFSIDIEHYISILSTLHDDFFSTYKTKISNILEQLTEREKNIIFLRNGFNEKKKLVLEEIGNLYGITRERVRQIESNGMKKICSNLYLTTTIFASIYLNIIIPGEKYISKERLKSFVKDDNLADFIALLMLESESYITYDSSLEIIYNKKISSINEIENEIIDAYGDIITLNDYESLDNFGKKVIKINYRLINDTIYLRKGVLGRTLITNIIDDLYPNGYKISSDEEFQRIKNEYIKRYGCWDDGLNMRIVSTYIDRENYCQIDRGTYKNRKYIAPIDNYLKDRIINYIIENQPTVFYQSIFEHFKSELEAIGVNNYYYLKGIIDVELPKEFNTKRNYIQIGKTKITSGATIINFIRNFDGIFTIEDLQAKFEGVKNYVIYNWLYSEIENGLIWLSAKKFIYIDKSNIDTKAISELEIFIDNLFISLNTKILSSRKIFSRLMLTNKALLDNLKVINDHFSLFSLIKYLFKNKYYFNRPLISADIDSSYYQEDAAKEYVSKLDKFNIKIIKTYQDKLSLRGLYSYLEFMENMSDEYVQVNVDTMVKKDLIGISDNFLSNFKSMFNLIFSKFKSIDTRLFNGYMLLPSLDYKWNKYLLVGIIRTFFSKEYEIENTSNYYNKTDFIIRKI